MPTREQERAQAVYERVSAKAGSPNKEGYGRVCADLPALIHQCGLCQALAFLQAKGKGDHKEYFHEVLGDLGQVAGLGEDPGARVRAAPVMEYQRLSHEALACAQWFSRYAEALLDAKRGQEPR